MKPGAPVAPPLDWQGIGSLLLVRLRSIGDTVLMTACLGALKGWRPDLEVGVVVEPLAAPLLEDHPLVDRLFVVGPSPGDRVRLISCLRRRRFDAAFNMHGGTTATLIARLSGAKTTAGYGDYHLAWLLGHRAPAPDRILGRRRIHSVEQQLALLAWAGVPWPAGGPRLRLEVAAGERARMAERLRALGVEAGGFAVLGPAAAFESKRWPAGGFAAVADHLRDAHGLPSVVIAGPGQEAVAVEVARGARGAQALTGLTLRELMALLGLARIFVGNDSGPMHIAAALDLPVVAIFGSSNPSVWHPWTERPAKVVGGRWPEAGDSPAPMRLPPSVVEGAETAIDLIPPGAVVAALDEVLQEAAHCKGV